MVSQVAIKRGKEDKGCLSEIMLDVVEKLLKMQSRMTKGPLCSFIRVYMHASGCVPNGVQEGAPAGMLFTAQKSDWIDKDLYLRWVNEVFLKQIPEERPVLLLVDGHKAHVTQHAIEAVP